MQRRWYLMTVLLTLMLVMVGCGGGDDQSSQDRDEDGTGGQAEVEQPLEIVGLTWTSAVSEETGEPVDSVESFTTISPAVIAVVEASDVPAGTVFTATWRIDGIEVPEATMEVTVEEDLATAWVAFEFIRAEGRYFPLGELEVTVSSGESIDAAVDIELP